MKLTISSLIVLVIIKIFVESLFLNILYGKAYLAVVTTRIVTQAIMLPLQIITIYLLEKAMRPFAKQYLYEKKILNINEYLDTFDKFTKDPNLDAMQYIMNEFGNPQKDLKVIHVAGTNGKGSICEMTANILIKQGYNVGKFISPHLINFNDEICFNNKEITDTEVEDILILLSEKISEYNKTHKVPVKWFEAITCIALIYFGNKKCDFVILETGLGGLTDCTNIVDSMVSVIGNIGYDHVNILGKTLESITEQKAGIIKSNSDAVFVYQDKITDIIENNCKEKDTKLHLIKKEDFSNYSYNNEMQFFNFKNYENIEINLKGKAQIYNAGEVLEVIGILKEKGYDVSEEAVRQGLKTVVHKARMELVNENPEIIFDGGHNENAIISLRDNIKQYYKDKKRLYIVSILKTKDYKKVLEILSKDKEAIFFLTSGNNKKKYISRDKLYSEMKKYFDDINIYSHKLDDAVKIAKRVYNNYTIFIVGSFYVYKDVMNTLKRD